MNVGGVETWLMHVLRGIDRERFQIDILVHSEQEAAYDREVLALGSRVFRCSHTTTPGLYSWQFLQVLKRSGPFDVLHSHVHHFSGLVLALGRIAGIPVRIAQSHSDTTAAESRAGIVRRMYLNSMERLIRAQCTHGFAVSDEAAKALFGSNWRQDKRLSVLYCGIDLAPFRAPVDSATVRAEFGFSPEDVIFGHAGRFSPVKNHRFLLEAAACIAAREPRAKFLLVGDGPLRAAIEAQAVSLGLKDKIVFSGMRSDIPRLLIGAMDVFLLPSLHEGLPIVSMESQAAGLPCLASEALTQEAIVNPALFRRLPLSAGPSEWARVACEIAEQPQLDRGGAVAILDGSRFDIRQGIQEMCDIYLGLGRTPAPIEAGESE